MLWGCSRPSESRGGVEVLQTGRGGCCIWYIFCEPLHPWTLLVWTFVCSRKLQNAKWLDQGKLSDASLAEKRLIYYCSHDPKKVPQTPDVAMLYRDGPISDFSSTFVVFSWALRHCVGCILYSDTLCQRANAATLMCAFQVRNRRYCWYMLMHVDTLWIRLMLWSEGARSRNHVLNVSALHSSLYTWYRIDCMNGLGIWQWFQGVVHLFFSYLFSGASPP